MQRSLFPDLNTEPIESSLTNLVGNAHCPETAGSKSLGTSETTEERARAPDGTLAVFRS